MTVASTLRGADDGGEAVSVLVPAYMAEDFIDRTMYLARGQTHPDLAILVSIDQSSDRTEAVVRHHAEADDRIEVHVHRERLGWAANVNFLLDRVATPYAFLYFHDDLIVPQYVERLLDAMRRRPDAASAHCTVGHFGGRNDVSVGHGYEGSAIDRLLEFLLAPERGSPLRSMLRTDRTASVRMPEHGITGLWANEPFLAALVAAGPALHVAETLYHRWDKREGGLTEGWKRLSPESVRQGWCDVIDAQVALVAETAATAHERTMLLTAVLLRYAAPIHHAEQHLGEPLYERPGDLHPALAELPLPPPFDRFDGELRSWAEDRWGTAVERKPSLAP